MQLAATHEPQRFSKCDQAATLSVPSAKSGRGLERTHYFALRRFLLIRDLHFDHIRDQAVLVAQNFHHRRRSWCHPNQGWLARPARVRYVGGAKCGL